MNERTVNVISYIIFVVVLLVLVYAFAGCKTKTVYVPVESVKTEYVNNHTQDSVHLYDSVFVKEKGNTVRVEKYKYLYRDKLIRDSVYVTDSIRVPYPVIEHREVNRLYTWQIVLMCLGGILLGSSGYKIIRFIR